MVLRIFISIKFCLAHLEQILPLDTLNLIHISNSYRNCSKSEIIKIIFD